MASGDAAAPVVQTVVLKVVIHCHGCKKKVRKVLRGIQGVQDVTVDASQHKVTVTGTVDADTLIKRLYKSGKKGVPWQCHPPAKNSEPAPEAPPAPQPAGDGGKDAAAAAVAAADKKSEEAVKEPQGESSEEKKKKKPEQEQEDGAAEKKQPEAESKEVEKVEAKTDGGDSEGAETKQAKGAAAEPAKEAPAAAGAANDEDEAKKSDKAKDAGTAEPAAVTTERSLPLAPAPAPKHAYEHEYRPPYYAAPAQPVLSYHAAQRSSSVSHFAPQAQPAYSTQQAHPHQAYYSAQQPQPQQGKQWSPSYLYMPYPHAAAPEPYYQQDYYGPPGMHASPMHDSSYRIFDDENPNSCSVM
ncbi:Heavy metal-associated isoprenylated plant protein 32 [Zea mays]|uniref:Heavy metal-associated isoprenylated plant protein 32 n=1 Tax=Zea mays TaxID=4577 RepID=A0A3L6DF87_MAIZE|nr:Heavy metal-associated isoprenylated plant protein 32 [Zea mays]